jgi:presqualene diphosphate synthase
MEMDAHHNIHAPRIDELDLYCSRVAVAVGLLSVRIFGVESEAADRVAHKLGRALQLTNILRDLDEDAARDRLYLPREWLRAHGIAATDPASVLSHPALELVCLDVASLAQQHYAAAEKALANCPRHKMRPAALMLGTYRALLNLLLGRGWKPLRDPVRISSWQKILLMVRYGLLSHW